MTRPLLPLLAILLTAPAPRDPLLFLGPLAPLFERAAEDEHSIAEELELPARAVDLTSEQIGDLGLLLRQGTTGQRYLAALALFYAGETAAARVLLEEVGEDEMFRGFALGALVTLKGEEARELLERTVVDHSKIEYPWTREVAGIALGLRRDPRSMTVLDEAAEDGVDGFAGFGADVARRWIREGEATTLFGETSPELEVIASILRSGLPERYDTDHFYDLDAPRLWRRHNGTWWIEPTEQRPEHVPYLRFEVHISQASQRAIVSVTLSAGRMCAHGWDFVLRRREGEWRVVGALGMWVS